MRPLRWMLLCSAACAGESGGESEAEAEGEGAPPGVPPVVTILGPADGALVGDDVALRFVVDVDSRWVEESEARVEGGETVDAIYFGGVGEYRAWLDVGEGESTVVARARTAGGWGEAEVIVVSDSTAPEVAFVEPADPTAFAGLARAVAFSASDDASGVDTASARVSVDGAPSVPVPYDDEVDLFRLTLTLPAGAPTIAATVADAAGNVGAAEIAVASAPRVLESVGTVEAPGDVERIAIAGGRAYLACGDDGLAIVDLPAVGDPALLATLDIGDAAHDVATAGARAVLAADAAGLAIVDVMDPAAPALTATVGLGEIATAAAIVGGVAYAGSASGTVLAIDVDALAVEGTAGASGLVGGLAVDGGFLYALAGGGVDVFSLADPLAPEPAGTLEVADGGDASGIGAFDGVVYVGTAGAGPVALAAGAPPETLAPVVAAGLATAAPARAVAVIVASPPALIAWGFGAGPGLVGAAVLGDTPTAVGVGDGHALVAYGATVEVWDLPPWVAETAPADGAEGVPLLLAPRVRFSELMDPVGAAAVTLAAGGATLTTATTALAGATAFVEHLGALAASTPHDLAVGAGLADPRGTPLLPDEGLVASFTTGAAYGATTEIGAGDFASGSVVIDFEVFPGPDGLLGTADDVDTAAPWYGLYVTGEWASVGVANFSSSGVVMLRSSETADPLTVCPRSPTTSAAYDGFGEMRVTFAVPVRRAGFWVGDTGGGAGMLTVWASGLPVSGLVDGPAVTCGDEPVFVGVESDAGIDQLVLTGWYARFDDFTFEAY